MFEHLMNRIKLLFGMGVVTLAKTGSVQVKMTTGVTNDKIKRVHNYGFMSHPLEGSKAYTLFVGGDVCKGIAVLVEDERFEIDLAPGDVALVDVTGNVVHLSSAGILVKSPIEVVCDCPKLTVNADMVVNGKTTLNGKTTAVGGMTVDGISFNGHVHNEHDGGSTGTPR